MNRNKNGYAKGYVFLDDGITKVESDLWLYESYEIVVSANSVQFFFIEGIPGT